MCREITEEEAREELIGAIKFNIEDISKGDKKLKENLDRLMFSVFCMIDGVSSGPAFDLIVRVHESDKEYHIENEENWYKDGMCINTMEHFHDKFCKKR